MTTPAPDAPRNDDSPKTIKCVIWDLDHTLWDGVLLEDGEVSLRATVVPIIETLDRRGILQSIASKNDHDVALAKLRTFGLDQYFLYPQINWNSKAASIQTIAQLLNINPDTFAFIDDQPFERQEVQFSLPQVRCFDVVELDGLLDLPIMNPRFITDDSRLRRQMYQSDIERQKIEEAFVGTKEEFLATLEMVFTLARAQEDDLRRAEELTVRTNQLNTTGYTYSYDELNALRQSPQHMLLIASLDDRYGQYGKIGLVLLECQPDAWTIKLLLMSCRVMSRGVGTIMLNHLIRRAQEAQVRLLAEFVPNNRNRMMLITYKFAGFKQVAVDGELVVLEHNGATSQAMPDYVTVHLIDT